MRKCSATVMPKNTPRPSGTWAMPSRARAVGDRPAMSAPPTRITPAIGRTRPGDRPQRGRLAGPVGTEQGDDLAGADVQVEVAHDGGRVVARRQRRRAGGRGQRGITWRPDPSRWRPSPGRRPPPWGRSRTSSGVPTAITRPNSSTDDPVADPEHEPHVVVDEEDRGAPIDDLAQVAAEGDRLLARRGRQPVRRGTAAWGRAASARATATSLRWPWVSSLGVASARSPSANTSSASSTALEWPSGRANNSLSVVPQRGMVGGDGEVLPHRQVVEQLDRLPRPGEPPPSTGLRAEDGDVGAVQFDGATMRHEPGDGVHERRLAGAVRADQADQLARTDLEIDVDHGVDAAEGDRDAAGATARSRLAHGSPGRRRGRHGARARSPSAARLARPRASAAAAAFARLAA